MTTTSAIALFLAMSLSALIPGPSVLAVVSRSISQGFRQGMFTVLGILLGDYLFIFLALSGLSAASVAMGEFASLIKYLGVSYLFWLAYQTWNTSIEGKLDFPQDTEYRQASSVLSGLVIALANPKAILFYMGFFPVFVDVTSIHAGDVFMILMISTLSVGGVLAVYAFLSAKSRHMFTNRLARKWLNRCSAGVLASCGVILVSRN
ncbi:LysE family translocator [Vibrio fluminensis]|uniref:LysE family translocator n=1 Tax=Vibrio fluminensis TaxID=2783614 RepID=UPI001887739C|nr:LysE family translocator [Vibrio fluminensis]